MTDYNNKGGRRSGGSFGGRRESYGKPAGGGKFGGKPFGEKRFGKPGSDRPGFDRPGFERGDGERSGRPGFDRPRGERPYGERGYAPRFEKNGERSGSDRPGYSRPGFGKPGFERPGFGKPGSERPGFDRPRGEKRDFDRPYGERAQAPRFEKSGRPGFDRPRGERRDFDRPRGERPDFDRPARPFGGDPCGGFRERAPKPGFEEERRESAENKPEELPNIIMGRNPVKEAIKSGRSIDRILVTKEHDGSLGEIIGLARDRNLIIREVDRHKLDELCMPFGHDGKTGNHQGIVAEIPGVEYSEVADILAYAEEKGEKPFVIVLDGIEDPHNLGSIIRSAECAGAHGVIIPKRRSSPVTATVVKTSAGAAEHMRIARVVNISACLEELKEAGLWIAGADMAGKDMHTVDMKGAFALVIGGEGDGLSKLVRERCDFLVSIPLRGSIDSLNAAVAAAIIMFEKNRQDG